MNPKTICSCYTDDNYNLCVPELAKKIKAKFPETVIILAGYPKDNIEEFTTAGVDIFIHVKANIFETLTDMQKRVSVIN